MSRSSKVRQRDPGLQPGQRSTQAGMNAVAEGDVRVGVTRDVEVVRVAKLLGVAVGGADHGQHQLAGRDYLAVQLDVTARRPHDPLQRRAVA